MAKQTSIFDEHVKLGGRIVDFAGWQMPVQYKGVMEEHTAVRERAGLFDVSHMGEFLVEGPAARAFLDYLVTNDVSRLGKGRAVYTVLCKENGGIVDDLIIYSLRESSFLVVVNASNIEKDFTHFQRVKESGPFSNCDLRNDSSRWALLALQGPRTRDVFNAYLSQQKNVAPFYPEKPFDVAAGFVPGVGEVIVAHTGYTGEDGLEIFVPWNSGAAAWNGILSAGQSFGIQPCGLAARDTLRLEKCYSLYGQEIDETTNPIEAGLSWVVKMKKENFVGKSALADILSKAQSRKLVGIKVLDRAIARTGYEIFSGNSRIGRVTSGSFSPSLKHPVALGYVPTQFSQTGTELAIEVRGEKHPAIVVETPFWKGKNS